MADKPNFTNHTGDDYERAICPICEGTGTMYLWLGKGKGFKEVPCTECNAGE